MSTCPSCGVWSLKGDTHTHYCIAEVKNPCPSCAALRARIALLEKVAKEVPFLLSVIASGEKLSDEEIYYQQEQLRAYNAALAEGKEGT